MLFNSFEFILIFLPVTCSVYFLANKYHFLVFSRSFLVFASLFFYSWWNVSYLPLMLTSILFNFAITNTIIRKRELHDSKRLVKFVFIIGLVFNVGFLMYFKYMDFFISNINVLAGVEITLLNLSLPLAISFFTLQQVAFLVDCYEGLVKENDFLNYTIFVAFFPQLIAGPIVHHKEMMPQFADKEKMKINYNNISLGLFIFAIGLFKKTVIADSFAIWATNGFDGEKVLSFYEAWGASLSYSIQLYFDFSGYTDMAIGAAMLFNIRLPRNFNSPYKASNIIDFWKRWHITLTSFITTYIYTPMARSFGRLTMRKAMLATFVTFLIAGLWHGASWMFVIFGALHGAGLVVNHYWKKSRLKINKTLSWFITINYVNIAFVFFRAKSMDDAVNVLKGMVNLPGLLTPYFTLGNYKFFILSLIIAFVLIMLKNSNQMETNFKTNIRYLAFTVAIFSIALIKCNSMSEFLYFNF